MASWNGIRRTVFVSFFGGDEKEVHSFVTRWADAEAVFKPIVLHDAYSADGVNSDDPEYVMRVIRAKFLADSTVTLLLMGTCTHSRRYVDWELMASLRQGQERLPNGLLAVNLPSIRSSLHLPGRFQDNWDRASNGSAYARWYRSPTDARELGGWIEDAYSARSSRNHRITNGREAMGYNARCRVCGITHPAA